MPTRQPVIELNRLVLDQRISVRDSRVAADSEFLSYLRKSGSVLGRTGPLRQRHRRAHVMTRLRKQMIDIKVVRGLGEQSWSACRRDCIERVLLPAPDTLPDREAQEYLVRLH